MKLQSGADGFQVKVECSSTVSSGKLKFNGTNYRNNSYGELAAGSKYSLFTGSKADHMGKTFTFESSYGGVTGTVTSTTVKSGASQPINYGVLPCALTLDDSNGQMTLSSGGAGFKIKLKCDVTISGGTLRFPGTNYNPSTFSNAFQAGGSYSLTTLRKSDWTTKTFQFDSEYNGRLSKTTVSANTLNSVAETFNVAIEEEEPPDAVVSGLTDGSGNGNGNGNADLADGNGEGLEAVVPDHSDSCSFFCKADDCKQESFLHKFCKGCPACTGEKPVETCWQEVCKDKSQCKSSYVLNEYCSGCDMCKVGKSDSSTDEIVVEEPKTDTCGKTMQCDRSEPAKYCNGWRKSFCGGCSWCP